MQKIEEVAEPIIFYYPQFASPELQASSQDPSLSSDSPKIKVQEKIYMDALEKNMLLQMRLREVERQNEALKAQVKPKRKYVKKRPHPQKKIGCPGCSAKYSSRMGLYLHLKKVPEHGSIPPQL